MAVAIAPVPHPLRRAALAAMQPADRPAADRRLAAGQAGTLAAGVAARRIGRIAAPIAVFQGFAEGHEVMAWRSRLGARRA